MEENQLSAFSSSNRFTHNLTICCLSLRQGNTESCKSLKQELSIFQLSPDGINEPFVIQLLLFIHMFTPSFSPGGGGTAICGPYRYVPLWRVWFSSSLL